MDVLSDVLSVPRSARMALPARQVVACQTADPDIGIATPTSSSTGPIA
jgi:hypothetical protein